MTVFKLGVTSVLGDAWNEFEGRSDNFLNAMRATYQKSSLRK
jgi:hypothetical protein